MRPSIPAALPSGAGRAAAALLATVSLAAGLAACGAMPPPGGSQLPRYQCEQGVHFSARFQDDSVALDSNRGYEVLYRDAGGVTPQQQVFSAPRRMRLETGLGEGGREMRLTYLNLPMTVRCVPAD